MTALYGTLKGKGGEVSNGPNSSYTEALASATAAAHAKDEVLTLERVHKALKQIKHIATCESLSVIGYRNAMAQVKAASIVALADLAEAQDGDPGPGPGACTPAPVEPSGGLPWPCPGHDSNSDKAGNL